MSVLEEHYTEVGGRRMRYLAGGQGKPLVLCHGFLSSAEEFGGRFADLAAQRTLIVPDLPGSAASAPLAGRHTAEALARSVAGLLDQLQVEDFDLGGLCLGASVACALARQCGERVGHLVLHTPLLRPGLVRARHRYQVQALTLPGPWAAVQWFSRQRTVSDLYKRFVIREGPVDARTSDINFQNQVRADPRAAKEWLRDGLRRDEMDLLVRRPHPTLIIVAANDGLVNVAALQEAVRALPRVALHVDPEAGHGWSAAAVRRHLAVLQGFFAECSAPIDS